MNEWMSGWILTTPLEKMKKLEVKRKIDIYMIAERLLLHKCCESGIYLHKKEVVQDTCQNVYVRKAVSEIPAFSDATTLMVKVNFSYA